MEGDVEGLESWEPVIDPLSAILVFSAANRSPLITEAIATGLTKDLEEILKCKHGNVIFSAQILLLKFYLA